MSLEKNFVQVYTKFKLEFYRRIFKRFEGREASLTATEVFCVEAIYALGRPSIQQFSDFIGVSTPNCAYKIGNLIKKGYVNKIQSERDKREYYLEVTDKFLSYYGLTYDHINKVFKKMEERFTQEELAEFNRMLSIINNELM